MSALTNITEQELIHEVAGAIAGSRLGLQKASAVPYDATGAVDGQRLKVYNITGQTGFAADTSGKTFIVVELDNAKLNALDEKVIGRRVSSGNLPT